MILLDLLSTMGNNDSIRRIIINSPEGRELMMLDKGMTLDKGGYVNLIHWDVRSFDESYVQLEVEVGDKITTEEADDRPAFTLRDLLVSYKRWETEREVIVVNQDGEVLAGLKFDMGDKLNGYFVCEDDEVMAWRVDRYNKDRDMYIAFKVMLK